MADYLIKGETLTAIADALRNKGGLYENMTPRQMPSYIQAHLLSTGNVDCIIDRTITSISNNTCTTIGDYAFANCIYLENITFTKCNDYGASAFLSCPLVEVTLGPLGGMSVIDDGDALGSRLTGNTGLTKVHLPGYTGSIGQSLFKGCTLLSDISFPNVRVVGPGAFYNCDSLTEISFPEATLFATTAFQNCNNISKVYAPLVSSVNAQCFQSCTNLTELYLPRCQSYSATSLIAGATLLNSVTFGRSSTMGTLFSNRGSYLTSVFFPYVTIFNSNCLRSCYVLSDLQIPNVSRISTAGLYDCSALQSIVIPYTPSLYANAFQNCINLTSVYLTSPSIGSLANKSTVFTRTPIGSGTGTIYVPSSLVATYQSSTNWSAYSSIIKAIPSTTQFKFYLDTWYGPIYSFTFNWGDTWSTWLNKNPNAFKNLTGKIDIIRSGGNGGGITPAADIITDDLQNTHIYSITGAKIEDASDASPTVRLMTNIASYPLIAFRENIYAYSNIAPIPLILEASTQIYPIVYQTLSREHIATFN